MNTTHDTPQAVLSNEINPRVTADEVEAEERAHDHDIQRRSAAGTPLVAEIKKSSKYFGQSNFRHRVGARFPVVVIDDSPCDYSLRGGPGGRYRLVDVTLFAVVGATHVKLT